jgi:glutamate-5-semialdehyde dehydrogenase
MSSHIEALGVRAKAAARTVGTLSTAAKDHALHTAADLLASRADAVLDANAADLAAAESAGLTATQLDRLRLTEARLDGMVDGLRQVALLADPVGRVVDGWVRPNGLRIEKVRVPLGVVAIVYENRPNVTSDAAALCLKSGNVAFLRGSASALRSNVAVADVLREAYDKAGVPADALVMVDVADRDSAREFMRLRGVIDVLIPRGGPSLIEAILEHATVPYVIDGDGNCHIYVHDDADLANAVDIVVNAKTQRPGVCNALETLLVHADIAERFLPQLDAAVADVELVGDDRTIAVLGAHRVAPATDDDWADEFLALKLAVRVVDGLDDAIDHIASYGSGHSEAILTTSIATADRFVAEVDAAAVLVNASTRFVDGGEFGFGAEIGISTQKLHARGPMGLTELTTAKYVVRGTGHTR